MLTPLAAVTLAFLAPQVVERQVTQARTETESVTVAPGVGQEFAAPDINIDAVLSFDLPDDEGVTHVRTQVTTTIWAEADIQVETLDATGTRFQGYYEFGLAACSSACLWGASDYWGSSSSFGTPTTVHSQGTSLSFNPNLCQESAPCVFNFSLSSAANEWSSVVNDPSARAIAQLGSAEINGYDLANDPTRFRLDSFSVDGSIHIEAINTLELSVAPLMEYCTSPVGSTGASATLEAYGSQQENTEFLTVRAQGLPQGSFALLFVGTAPANQPSGSTTLCVGGAVARMGGVVNAEAGTADFDIDLLGRTAGTQLFLQSFFRDPTVGVVATNASSFVVRPRI